MKRIICFFAVTILSLTFLDCIAFLVPDISVIGKNPEIKKIEPPFLIPGQKVEIHGSNFFEFPKSANKLWINNHPVRIHSAKGGLIEFIVPKLPLGKAKIKLFTSYLGYKSKEIYFPQDQNEFLVVTFNPPELKGVDSVSVKPNLNVLVYGSFSKKDQLFFKIGDEEFQGEVISSNISQVWLPKKLPNGPFKIQSFYKRKIFKKEEYVNSVASNELVLFNVELGSPLLIKLELPQKQFHEIGVSFPYKVNLYFRSGENVDVTEYSKISLLGDEVFDLNIKGRLLKIIKNGSAKIKADFIWSPTNLELEDTVSLSVKAPSTPGYRGVIINEVFPFSSGKAPLTDANMDGFARTNDDKFVEFKNLTNDEVDLAGCVLYLNEDTLSSYRFSDNAKIAPLSYLVLFGSDTEKNKLDLLNSGSVIELVCDGKTIDYVAYPAGKIGDPSWQRKTDLSGFEKHLINLFSPGGPPPELSQTLNHQDEQSQMSALNIDSVVLAAPPQIKELFIAPSELLFLNQLPRQLNIVAEYFNGQRQDITNKANYKIIGDDKVITVDKSGLITPLMNGSVTIEVGYEDKTLEIIANVNFLSEVQVGQLVINEILAAPNVDVNKDSLFKSDNDEFIEIVNISNVSLDVSGLIISDNTKVRHVIPEGTVLQSFEPIVIFGGGNISNFSTLIKSQVASTGSLGLNNTGAELVTLSTNDSRVIDQAMFDNANLQGVSLNRVGDLSFNTFAPHDSFLRSLGKFSPGTRIDGSSFVSAPQEGADLLKSTLSTSSSSSSSSSGLINSNSSSSSSSSGCFHFTSSSSGEVPVSTSGASSSSSSSGG